MNNPADQALLDKLWAQGMRPTTEQEQEEIVIKLTKDLKSAATKLTANEVRFLVDSYYQMQENRIRSAGQCRAMDETREPHEVLGWLMDRSDRLEQQVKAALDAYSRSHPVGQWARSIKGIGPVIAAGLLAHIDITKAPTVGHIWRYAGLDPTSKWEKGQKRPWNASLKVLCWKIGESFVKVSSYDDDVYGKVYLERKAYEERKNEAGDYKTQADAGAARVAKTTEAFKSYAVGKLPKGHLHSRAKRYAVKLFLSHLHEVWYKHHFKTDPPKPYPIAFLGHAHKKEVPNAPAA